MAMDAQSLSVHVAAHPQVVIGTLDTYIQPELQLFFEEGVL